MKDLAEKNNGFSGDLETRPIEKSYSRHMQIRNMIDRVGTGLREACRNSRMRFPFVEKWEVI